MKKTNSIINLLNKWKKELKDEKDERIFDHAARIDPLPREMVIERLETCIKELEKLL